MGLASGWVGFWVGGVWSFCCLHLAVISQAAEVAAICSGPACCVSEANPVACLVMVVWGPLRGAVCLLTQQHGDGCWPRGGFLHTAQEVARGPQPCACRFQRMLVVSCFAAYLRAAPIACCVAHTTAVQYAAVLSGGNATCPTRAPAACSRALAAPLFDCCLYLLGGAMWYCLMLWCSVGDCPVARAPPAVRDRGGGGHCVRWIVLP